MTDENDEQFLKLECDIGVKQHADLFKGMKSKLPVIDIIMMCTSNKVFLKTISYGDAENLTLVLAQQPQNPKLEDFEVKCQMKMYNFDPFIKAVSNHDYTSEICYIEHTVCDEEIT